MHFVITLLWALSKNIFQKSYGKDWLPNLRHFQGQIFMNISKLSDLLIVSSIIVFSSPSFPPCVLHNSLLPIVPIVSYTFF